MSYWIHIYTYLTELLTCHIYKLIFTSFCPSFQLIPVRFLFLLLPIHPKIFYFLLSLLSPLSCLPCLLHYTAFPFPWLFPSLVSFDFKLTNPDEILDHNNLQVFEFFMSLQPACRTTAANFETVALSRQTVLTRIISLEVSYAAGLQSEICLPFFLNASFSFYISFWVFMGVFFGFFLFVRFGFFNNQHTEWFRTKRWKHSHSWVSRVHKDRLQLKENPLW